MNNTSKLTQIAQQQTFDQRNNEIFDAVYQEVDINDIAVTTPDEGDRLVSFFKNSDASPEFIKNMLVYSLQKGMPLYVVDHIMNSDEDLDGRTLSQELFEDNTDPFETDTRRAEVRKSRQIELEL